MKGIYFLLSMILVLLCFCCYFLFDISYNLYAYMDSLGALGALLGAL